MHFSEYIEYDAVGLAHLIKSGQVSAQEVQQLARQAILAVNLTLNALVGELFEEALPSSTTGPSAGVPFAIKDFSLHAAGVKIGIGTRLTGEGIVFPHDTDLMTRFKQAGLVTLGRTATPEFAFNATTEPVANGPTHNPWDPSRSPGGSSGGSAALVSARAIPVAHGTDGAGSIRILMDGVDWLDSRQQGDVSHLARIPTNASQVLALILLCPGRYEIPRPC